MYAANCNAVKETMQQLPSGTGAHQCSAAISTSRITNKITQAGAVTNAGMYSFAGAVKAQTYLTPAKTAVLTNLAFGSDVEAMFHCQWCHARTAEH